MDVSQNDSGIGSTIVNDDLAFYKRHCYKFFQLCFDTLWVEIILSGDFKQYIGANVICSYCLENMGESPHFRLIYCNHRFHKRCLMNFFMLVEDARCPQCSLHFLTDMEERLLVLLDRWVGPINNEHVNNELPIPCETLPRFERLEETITRHNSGQTISEYRYTNRNVVDYGQLNILRITEPRIFSAVANRHWISRERSFTEIYPDVCNLCNSVLQIFPTIQLDCFHRFHKMCITKTWMEVHTDRYCPICAGAKDLHLFNELKSILD